MSAATPLHRYFVQLSYKGTRYHGWQVQPNAVTIQAHINKALSTILKEDIETTGAGRTDTGVHARYFIAHFDSGHDHLAGNEAMIYKINSLLPFDIAVHRIIQVPHSAHARFDALARTYEYVITTKKDPFLAEYAWLYYTRPDLMILNKASRILRGSKDFSSFSKLHSDVATYHCNVMEASWKEKEGRFTFTIKADRFLRNMVRAIVGTMLHISCRSDGKIRVLCS